MSALNCDTINMAWHVDWDNHSQPTILYRYQDHLSTECFWLKNEPNNMHNMSHRHSPLLCTKRRSISAGHFASALSEENLDSWLRCNTAHASWLSFNRRNCWNRYANVLVRSAFDAWYVTRVAWGLCNMRWSRPGYYHHNDTAWDSEWGPSNVWPLWFTTGTLITWPAYLCLICTMSDLLPICATC